MSHPSKKIAVAVWTLAEKLDAAERLHDAGGHIKSETRFARVALADELARHETAKRAIAERFDIEAWRAIEKLWSEKEITA